METGKVPKDGGKAALVSPSQDTFRDFGNFVFWNGDKYEGYYVANKQHLSIFRDGQGSYCTNQSVYKGKWSSDILEKVDEITFPDNSIFTGILQNMTIEGPGMYKFEEGIEIYGNLQNNHFVGDIMLKDPNGHCWEAFNPMNEEEIFFTPVQPFWQSLLKASNSVLPIS